MRRIAVLLSCLLVTFGAEAQQTRRRTVTSGPAVPVVPPPVVAPPAGASLTGLTAAQLAAFNAGRGVFNRDETTASGLGPVFNQASCGECHSVPAIGGGGGNNRNVTRIARRVNGIFDPLTSLGGSLLQNRAIAARNGSTHNFVAETVPAAATIVVRRRTTPLFGLGLVDATPDADFIALAAAEVASGSGVAGRVNMTDNIRAGAKTVGRFGWKAQVPTLFQFAGDALVNEEGITTPDFPNENCPQGNCAELAFNPAPGLNDTGTKPLSLADFMIMLAPPPRGTQTVDTVQGEQLFQSIGCAACHTATLTTGASTIGALDHQTYHPSPIFCFTTWEHSAMASRWPTRPEAKSAPRRCGAFGSSDSSCTTDARRHSNRRSPYTTDRVRVRAIATPRSAPAAKRSCWRSCDRSEGTE
jgi:mono/diheme cytochrome c family protein